MKKIKLTMKEMIQARIDATDELYSMNINMMFEKYQVGTTSDEIRVLHHSNLLHGSGIIIAGTMKMPLIDGTLSDPIIIVDDYFMELPPNIQKWFIYHELGHINNNHLDRSTSKLQLTSSVRAIASIFGFTTKMEIEADEYATKKTSVITSMRALNWIQKHCNTMNVIMECAARKRHIMTLTK